MIKSEFTVRNATPEEMGGIAKIVSAGRMADIFEGCWIDRPQGFTKNHRGFEGFPGIYLVRAGSNTAYGNYAGGFRSVSAAQKYNDKCLGGLFKVAKRH